MPNNENGSIHIVDVPQVTTRILVEVDEQAAGEGSYMHVVPDKVASRLRYAGLDESAEQLQARNWLARDAVLKEIVGSHGFGRVQEVPYLRQPFVVFNVAGGIQLQSYTFQAAIPPFHSQSVDMQIGRVQTIPRVGERVSALVELPRVIAVYIRPNTIPQKEGDALIRKVAIQVYKAVEVVGRSPMPRRS